MRYIEHSKFVKCVVSSRGYLLAAKLFLRTEEEKATMFLLLPSGNCFDMYTSILF